MYTRTVQFAIPFLWRERGLDLRVVVDATSEKPKVWPEAGSRSASVVLKEGQHAHFGIFFAGRNILDGRVMMRNSHVMDYDEVVVPIIGKRGLGSVQIIPWLLRKERA